MKATLTNGQQVGTYLIDKFLKTSVDEQVETYAANDNNGNKFLLKLYKQVSLPAFAGNNSDDTGNNIPIEYTLCNTLQNNDTLASFIASGTVEVDDCEYGYMVRQYVDGTRLSDMFAAGKVYSWSEAVPTMLQILSGLQVLHSRRPIVIHNDLTANNVIVRQDENGKEKVCIIGTGHLSHRIQGRAPFNTSELNMLYRAPETFIGMFDEQSDIFSAGVLLFTMLTGREPWAPTDTKTALTKKTLRDLRQGNVDIVDNLTDIPEDGKAVLKGMLAPDYDERFRSVDDVIKALSGEPVNAPIKNSRQPCHKEPLPDTHIASGFGAAIQPRTGGGFADVAGMEDVKQMLFKEVTFVMQNKEKATKYRLKTSNGALFYGPPGCGKTFIAEKFAEESHLNFMMVKASDLGSIYIHGTQGKIAELFDEAAKKAPTVICFDELDGMVPDRSNIHNEGASGEVNEFLSQLNNCSARGIFVIGTSNRPEKIDRAVLRAGRIEKLVYIPMPDLAARRELFRIHLADRYCDESIDFDELAQRSDGYVASDIELLVNETALDAAMYDVPIGQQLLLDKLARMRKSVSSDDAAAYEKMRKQFEEGSNANRRPIGYTNR